MSEQKSTGFPQTLDYHQIVELVPYRSPWLLIDRVLSWDKKNIVVQKAISGADPMMAAHLTEGPSIMPGVLYIEFVGQSVMLLGVLSGKGKTGTAVLARCKGEFLSPAFIGETITAEVKVMDEIAGKTVYEGTVKAGERMVCRVSGMGAMVPGPIELAV
jgi:3-hydroxymyristoyl/3-hydroxydecanoyl-(acyl carrier protein) dehydratase